MTTFAQAPCLGTERFVKTFDRVAAEFDRLNDTDVTFAVWSGAHAAFLGGHRDSQDIDGWVADTDLDTLTNTFPTDIFPGVDIVDTYDRYMVRPRADLIEFMGRMTVHTPQGAFDLRLEGNAADRIRYYPVGNRIVPFAAPEDTILLKAWLGRGSEEGKHDLADIAAIARSTRLDHGYLWSRIHETRSEDRVLRLPLMAEILFDY